eukprot:605681-Hanusia_phi.AAC.1
MLEPPKLTTLPPPPETCHLNSTSSCEDEQESERRARWGSRTLTGLVAAAWKSSSSILREDCQVGDDEGEGSPRASEGDRGRDDGPAAGSDKIRQGSHASSSTTLPVASRAHQSTGHRCCGKC